MRYLLLSYYKKANGQTDEVLALTNNLKNRDLECSAVILDFRKLQVIKASLNGANVPKDWDRVVAFYYQYYANVIDRLFRENGYEVVKPETKAPAETS